MYQIVASNKFLKDLKLLKKRSLKDFALLQDIVTILAERPLRFKQKTLSSQINGKFQRLLGMSRKAGFTVDLG
ncbi:hypothetical protein GCM10022289_27690 [Pedobacter jeongneungensis]|uniref:RelE toxin of RelEB toxin-antitoxin system n=1 Tax=Pedobacter jeongneungensis TaxID=947309 RepID=A0ABP8BHH5_9SPHI